MKSVIFTFKFNRIFSHLKPALCALVLFFSAGYLWPAIYVYKNGSFYEYSGSSGASYEAILADTTESNFSEITNPSFVSGGQITVDSGNVILVSSETNVTAGSIVVESTGTFVNFGTLSFTFGLTNNGNVTNYGSITASNNSTNAGTITNEATANFIIPDGSQLFNTDSASIVNDGTFTGTITGSGTKSGSGTYSDGSSSTVTVSDTKTYYWSGAVSDSWSESGNWNFKGINDSDGSEVYVSVRDYVDASGNSYNGYYPGYEDACAAEFSLTAQENILGFKVENNSYSLTINNDSQTYGINLSTAADPDLYPSTLTISGYLLFSGIENLGALVNNGKVEAGGTSLTFKGTYSGSGSFKASSGETYFLGGNADFSSCSNFDANGGTIYFYNTDSLSSPQFKMKNGMALNNFMFAGNEEIVVSGSCTAALFQMHANGTIGAQSADFETVISGGSGDILSVTDIEIDRANATSSTNSGSLTLNADVAVSNTFITHSQTTVNVNKGLTTVSFYDQSSSDFLLNISASGILEANSVKAREIYSEGSIILTGSASTFLFDSYSGNGSDSITMNGGTIVASDTASNGTIGNLILSSGSTTLGYDSDPTATFKIGNLTIESGSSMTAGAEISISGNLTNNNSALSGFTAGGHSVTFTGSSTEISGNTEFYSAIFTGSNVKITGNNKFSSFSCTSPGCTFTFGSGTSQTVEALTISGTDGNEIILTGNAEWNITPEDVTKISIAHAKIINSKNTDSANQIVLYSVGGYNIDGGNNTNWIFAGQLYTWTGSLSSDSHESANWQPAAVPGPYSSALIPLLPAGGNYPKLTADLNLATGSSSIDVNGSSITVSSSLEVEDGADFDFAGYSVIVNDFTIGESTRLLLYGSEDTSNLGAASSPDYSQNGIIEYYGSWGTNSLNLGNTFHQLEFTSGSSGRVPNVTVKGKTLIGEGNSVTFTGTLNSTDIITIEGNVNAGGNAKFASSRYILVSGSTDCSFSVTAGSLTFTTNTFVDLNSSATLSITGNVSFSNSLCLYSGMLSSLSTGSIKNLFAFGSDYNADDPRYSSSDTRFACYEYTSLAYKKSAFSGLLVSNSAFKITQNLYVNGLPLSEITFTLPNSASSNPVFNATSTVTEKQWGVPYAVVFNSTVSNCSAQAQSGSAFVTSALHQKCVDGANNSGFQFSVPKIEEAYSVSDSVICLKFDMALENSHGEVAAAVAKVTSLASGGIFYNKGSLPFDGVFYTVTDGVTCSSPISTTSDIEAHTPLYLKLSASSTARWNTDATGSEAGEADSTDRYGVHQSQTTDLSFMEGLFYAAEGKTMCRNYGSGLWSEDASSYSTADVFEPEDKARPVLVDLFAGQELFSKNTGSADSQKFYDSHNFIELRYSEPVNIGDLDAALGIQNSQAQTSFSATSHGGSLEQESGKLLIKGYAAIASGSVTAGYRDGNDHKIDTAKPHALYRKFALNAGLTEQIQKSRIRISVAGYVDETSPIPVAGSQFYNWIGYIDSSESPSGLVTVKANDYITDLEGNKLDASNSSRTIIVNSPSPSIDSACIPGAATSLYSGWDCLPPVFATYVQSLDSSDKTSWTEGDSSERIYEIIGMVDSNTSAYLDRVEIHLFDNRQNYSSSDEYKWVSQNGWTQNGILLESFKAPESAGGTRPFSSGANITGGGIRRSSLEGSSQAFQYVYILDNSESEKRNFNNSFVSQNVKSALFRNESLTITTTENDGPYISLALNPADNKLPVRTSFILTFTADKSFITDLAGNRLIQTDDGSQKTLHSLDITPPSFSIILSPLGENKVYAVFTKPLADENRKPLSQSSQLDAALQKIGQNLEFVDSRSDNIDTSVTINDISIEKVELAESSSDYTALLFTLNRKITLTDVEKTWIRINDEGTEVETFSGTVTASYLRDVHGNAMPFHTCHALSDFAINAVNVLYARSLSDESDNWDEQGIYGSGISPVSSDYAAHDFSSEGGNYSKLRSDHDIMMQVQLVSGEDSDGYIPVQNSESFLFAADKKSNLKTEWISDRFNRLTGSNWRIWLDARMSSLASGFNNRGTAPAVIESVTGSELLKNVTLKNSDFNFTDKSELQFFFKLTDPEKKTGLETDSNDIILIDNDGDTTTNKIPLYAMWMPSELIRAGKFSFLDLWSFSLTSISSQRGGVSILNNVIDAGLGEKTVIQVDMKSSGNLNIFVMTLDGNIVQRLEKGSVSAGLHYYYWDGKNNSGDVCARGLYFVRVTGSGIDETRKVMLVK